MLPGSCPQVQVRESGQGQAYRTDQLGAEKIALWLKCLPHTRVQSSRTHVHEIQGGHRGLPAIPPWDSRSRDPQSKLDMQSSHTGRLD